MKQEIKQKIANYLIENEGGKSAKWTDSDVVTTYDENGEPLQDYIIEEEDGEYYYTPVTDDCEVTMLIEF